jgi:hypothetical protein
VRRATPTGRPSGNACGPDDGSPAIGNEAGGGGAGGTVDGDRPKDAPQAGQWGSRPRSTAVPHCQHGVRADVGP